MDNLQLIHSASLSDPATEASRFVADLQRDWEVEDEGPMTDMLAMEVVRNPDGSIKLHQAKYVHKLIRVSA